MKILLIGDFTDKGDEGLSQISKRIAELMSVYHEILKVNTKDTISPKNLIKIYQFNPHIIHYATGITIRSFILEKVIKLICLNKPKTILSAVRVFLTPGQIKFIKYLKPNLILTQAQKWESIFQSKRILTMFLPNPIDINKFKKIGLTTDHLKEKYGIPINKKIILHVGHIRKNRNLESLIDISEELEANSYKVLIVSSPFFAHDVELYEGLISSGFIVVKEHVKNIEELYNAADIYFFPVRGLEKNYYPKIYNEVGVIDLPLSVLEAIAVGLPIVTTKIDALERILEQNTLSNLVIWDGKKDLIDIFNNMIKLNINPYWNSVDKFSFQKVSSELQTIYNNLVV